jgi:Flp pilus assembly protein TadD
MTRWKLCFFGTAILASLVFVVYVAMLPTHEALVRNVRLTLAERNYGRAEQLVSTILKRFDSRPESWLIAGEVAARSEHWHESLDRYERVVTDQNAMQSEAAYGRGEACIQLGKFERAEREFRAALDADSDATLALRRLVDVLIFTGRRHRAAPWLEHVITTPRGTLDDLFHLGDLDHLVSRPASTWAATKDPDADVSLVLGAGLQALIDGRNEQAISYFNRVLDLRPADPEALAGRGQALLQTNPTKLISWRAQLPMEVTQDAGVLAVLGQLAVQENRPQDATQHFAQVVIQRPTSRVAWHQLGLSLRRIGQISDAELALERARQLQELGTWLNDLFGQRQNLGLVRRVTERLAKLGRLVEATAWTQHALTVAPNEVWAIRLRDRLQQSPATLIDQYREQTLESLLAKFGPSHPTQAIQRPEDSHRPSGHENLDEATSAADCVVSSKSIRFVDAAADVGLQFVYRSARDDRTPSARIIETVGGGVGVIDYDCDGWPDLYFTQGSREFPLPENNPDLDRLFRNREGHTWSDVSTQAGLGDANFGQGVAVGDINNDGFPDLYVANYGVNVLYQNQGDGTFQDVTPPELRQQKVWTSSCLIADLNGDGWPDLFDVTYCHGDEVPNRH